jgi:hypothetical protein
MRSGTQGRAGWQGDGCAATISGTGTPRGPSGSNKGCPVRNPLLTVAAAQAAVFILWRRERLLSQSRSRKSAQDDKWSFCLTAGALCPVRRQRQPRRNHGVYLGSVQILSHLH